MFDLWNRASGPDDGDDDDGDNDHDDDDDDFRRSEHCA